MRSPLLAAVLLSLPAIALAQGALTPPASAFANGAPAPTMHTLDQLEPRTPIPGGSAAFAISVSGSYYLTGNLTVTTGDAITISADNVTLDLNGFTISSTAYPFSGSGIELTDNRHHVLIRNGHISGTVYFVSGGTGGTGFNYGIHSGSVWPNDVTVEDVTVYGVAEGGISLRPISTLTMTTTVRRCAVASTAGFGIEATRVLDCLVDNCRASAIGGFVANNSYGYGTSGHGIVADEVTCCYGKSNIYSGINGGYVDTSYGYTATKTTGQSESGYGIRSYNATNSYGDTYSGTAALYALSTASFCFGNYYNNTAITGLHAFGCTAAGNITSTNKDLCY
jgi:hypothetical protein